MLCFPVRQNCELVFSHHASDLLLWSLRVLGTSHASSSNMKGSLKTKINPTATRGEHANPTQETTVLHSRSFQPAICFCVLSMQIISTNESQNVSCVLPPKNYFACGKMLLRKATKVLSRHLKMCLIPVRRKFASPQRWVAAAPCTKTSVPLKLLPPPFILCLFSSDQKQNKGQSELGFFFFFADSDTFLFTL